MCGIAGILRSTGAPVSELELRGLAQRMTHRGPDGEGVWARGPFGLAHRRLAILDPDGGAQPFANDDESVCVAFNGEIYNFRALRHELTQKGHVFRTTSDTEVLLRGWEEWGEAVVEKLRGMFAFAIVDRRTRELFLARDPLGIKPLVYSHVSSEFRFASELATLDDGSAPVDLSAIDEYLWRGYISAPHTAISGLKKLEPGHCLRIEADGSTTGPRRFWSWGHGHREQSYAHWLDEVSSAVDETVRAHLVADVPFGAFLSGGVDSTLVVERMTAALERPVETFSIGFDEPEYDERVYAEQAARRFGTHHHFEVVRPDALELLPKLVRHYGEPFGDASAVPTWHVCRLARSVVPMVLSGDGGDEFFGGYHSYRGFLREAPQLDGRSDHADLARWRAFFEQQSACRRRSLWRRDHLANVGAAEGAFAARFEELFRYAPVTAAQRLDQQSYLPFDILAKVDIASMMHGLEVRTPLVDVRIATLANEIAANHHFEVTGDAIRGKRLLKDLLRRTMGDAFVDRKKMGFGLPVDRWLGVGGSHERWVHERFLGRDAPLCELFEPERVHEIAAAGAVGPLWQLLVLDEWLRQRRGKNQREREPVSREVVVLADRGAALPRELVGCETRHVPVGDDRWASLRAAADELAATSDAAEKSWVAVGPFARAIAPFVAASRGESCTLLVDDDADRWVGSARAPHLASETIALSDVALKLLEQRGVPRVRRTSRVTVEIPRDGGAEVACSGLPSTLMGDDRIELDDDAPVERAMAELADRCLAAGTARIVVYGAGEAGRRLVRCARALQLEVVAVVDGNTRRQGRSFEGLSVVAIDDALRAAPDGIAIATLRHVDGIRAVAEGALARAGISLPIIAPRHHEGSA